MINSNSSSIQQKIENELKILDDEEKKINNELEHYINNKGVVSPSELLNSLSKVEIYNTSFEILTKDSKKLTNHISRYRNK